MILNMYTYVIMCTPCIWKGGLRSRLGKAFRLKKRFKLCAHIIPFTTAIPLPRQPAHHEGTAVPQALPFLQRKERRSCGIADQVLAGSSQIDNHSPGMQLFSAVMTNVTFLESRGKVEPLVGPISCNIFPPHFDFSEQCRLPLFDFTTDQRY